MLRAAATVGATNADVVAVEARRIAEHHGNASRTTQGGGTLTAPAGRVVSLTGCRLADPTATIAALPADIRPLPSVDAHDELLARRRDPHPTTVPDGPTTTRNEVS
ncbi:hypothetical protein [Saccharothrix sp. Mg75]|uniref:hypothetical protein n=1 Tax=Saccharothrix sp. Mg75 TaxID=3445357 RepID=UPI003EE9D901